MPQNPLQYARLDAVRAFAVLLVLCGHLGLTLGVRHTGGVAHFGVVLFFVHTSFVLFLSLERLSHDGGSLFWRFYIRRAFRIYPLSVFVLLSALAFGIPRDSWGSVYRTPSPSMVVSNLLLLQNVTGHDSILAPLWSLPFEVQMYIVLPALFVLLRRVSAGWIWIAAFIFSACLQFNGRIGYLTMYAPCFCAGIVAYSLSRGATRRIGFRSCAIAIGLILSAGVAGAHVLPLYAADGMAALAAGIAIGISGEPNGRRFNRSTAAIAKYSYGIYLAHIPVLWICLGGHATLTGLVFCAVFLCGAVVAMYYGIERPLIRSGIRLTQRPRAGTVEALEYRVASGAGSGARC